MRHGRDLVVLKQPGKPRYRNRIPTLAREHERAATVAERTRAGRRADMLRRSVSRRRRWFVAHSRCAVERSVSDSTSSPEHGWGWRQPGFLSFQTRSAAAARVLEQKQAGWSNSRHESTWIRSLETYAFPRIGGRLVSEVTSADVLDVLTPIWHEKAQTARRVRQRIRTVLEWAVAMELRPDNPCDRIGPVLGPQRAPVQHMRALPHQDVPAAVKAVRDSGAAPVVKLAFELLVLTAARWGEIRGAEWAEIDTSDRVWTIPATRMKAQRAHRVPLCGRAIEILKAARMLGDGSGPLVFPSGGGTPLPDKKLRQLLQDRNIAAVPHGFRSSFRDWAAERTDHPREVIEAALAHAVLSKVEAAYARSDLFERRRLLMDDWSTHLDGERRAQDSSRN